MSTKTVGENDMTALRDISEVAIAENLEERLKAGIIYVSGFDLESLYHYQTAIYRKANMLLQVNHPCKAFITLRAVKTSKCCHQKYTTSFKKILQV